MQLLSVSALILAAASMASAVPTAEAARPYYELTLFSDKQCSPDNQTFFLSGNAESRCYRGPPGTLISSATFTQETNVARSNYWTVVIYPSTNCGGEISTTFQSKAQDVCQRVTGTRFQGRSYRIVKTEFIPPPAE